MEQTLSLKRVVSLITGISKKTHESLMLFIAREAWAEVFEEMI
jgi:hypothetical protein